MVAGRRVTDDAALEVAKMVYAGHAQHRPAVGAARAPGPGGRALAAWTPTCSPRTAVRRSTSSTTPAHPSVVDYGHVGDIDRVDPRVLATLMEARFVPVVASLAGDDDGNVYNVNADTVAETLAVALRAQKLIFLTGVPGVLRDRERSRRAS